jgi:hypothetical protein
MQKLCRKRRHKGVALNDDDVDSSVDGDAILRKNVQVDNKVRDFPLFSCWPILFRPDRSHSNAYGTPSIWTKHFHGPRG